ncbi:hypothetical protein GMORB2_5951 [Geosmithia morbida]|uniref:Myb-like domain-containing protein n=1 Tax=Geosmithia morbida TaxID=1094350 RepID=A0A9P5D5X9_9HYPO|nr:uncharacterized protein GMORB2_5951 [Geosmithia morbida]KAF4124235.1 hypothetical protein GMORB2_5951 [Geosmithia morbida]
MSSMFKKKGGPAFKPKIPSARPRPASAASAAAPRPDPVEKVPTPESIPLDSPDTQTPLQDGPAVAAEPGPSSPPIATTSPAMTDPQPASKEPTSQARVEGPGGQAQAPTPPASAPVASTSTTADAPEVSSAPPKTATETTARVAITPDIRASQRQSARAISDTPAPEPVSEETPAQNATSETVTEPPSAAPAPAPKPRAKRAAAAKRKETEDDTAAPATAATREPKRQRKMQRTEGNGQVAAAREESAQPATTRKRRTRSTSAAEKRAARRARSLTPEDAEDQVVDLQKLKIGGGASAGPQFRIVDGQIVLDQSSLVMDRHARAAATAQDMEAIEENDFTRLITSNSFMNTSKLRGPNIWTADETELFYRGLRMFGTDFEILSKMFPGKQRRHLKLKFNREERHNPHLIDAAMCGVKTTKMDIDEYKAFTGAEFESVESIEADQRRIEEEFEAQRQRAAHEQEEAMRKKREELFADDDDAAGAADKGKKKKGNKKKGRQVVEYGLNGEPINT